DPSFSFYLAQPNYFNIDQFQNYFDISKIYIRASESNSWILYKNLNTAIDNWTYISDSIPDTFNYFQLRLVITLRGGYGVSFDDFRVGEQLDVRPPPADVTLTYLRDTMAHIMWHPGGSGSGYLYALVAQGTDPDLATPISHSDTLLGLGGLIPNTGYDFYVKEISGTDTSHWSPVLRFTTDFSGVNPGYYTGFESPSLPFAWRANVFTDEPYSEIYLDSNFIDYNGRFLSIYLEDNRDFGIYASTPILNFNNSGNTRIRFKASATYTPVELQLGRMNYFDNTYSFSLDTSLFLSNTVKEYKINLDSMTSGRDRVAFLHADDWYETIFLDDFYYELIPDCDSPDSLHLLSVSDNSAGIGWLSTGGGDSLFIIEYGPQSFTPGTGTFITSNTLNKTITSLAPATDYDVYVAEICTPSTPDTGLWAGPLTLATACSYVDTGWTDGFEAYSATIIPPCFYAPNPSGTALTYKSVFQSNSDSMSFYLFNSSCLSESCSPMLILPGFKDITIGNRVLNFYAKSASAEFVVVGVLSNPIDPASFQPLDTFTLSSSYQLFTVAFADYAFSGNFVGIRHGSSGMYRSIYLDDFEYTSAPISFDLRVDSVGQVGDVCATTMGTDRLRVFVSNNGTDTISGFSLAFTVNGVGLKTFSTASILNPGDTTSIYFTDTLNYSVAGTFYLQVFNTTTGDQNKANDTAVKVLNIFPPPSISLGSDTSICTPNNLQLSGPAGCTYTWSTGANTQIAYFAIPDTYSLIATDTLTGCVNGDTMILSVNGTYAFFPDTGYVFCTGDSQLLQPQVFRYSDGIDLGEDQISHNYTDSSISFGAYKCANDKTLRIGDGYVQIEFTVLKTSALMLEFESPWITNPTPKVEVDGVKFGHLPYSSVGLCGKLGYMLLEGLDAQTIDNKVVVKIYDTIPGSTLGDAQITFLRIYSLDVMDSVLWTSIPSGFNSSVANPYVHPSAYTTYNGLIYTNGCSDTAGIGVQAKPSLAVNNVILARDTGIYDLDNLHAYGTGGTFYGAGVVGTHQFDPDSVGRSVDTCVYVNSTQNTCSDTTVFSIEVSPVLERFPAIGAGKSMIFDSIRYLEAINSDLLDFENNQPLTIEFWFKT
ncbi:MAG: fibronectin type III domain-containing protein, partial [Flavobacteriales bacterium]|nr:fibronectin type III domain-containing protein [Flavobacteriales bacterium]